MNGVYKQPMRRVSNVTPTPTNEKRTIDDVMKTDENQHSPTIAAESNKRVKLNSVSSTNVFLVPNESNPANKPGLCASCDRCRSLKTKCDGNFPCSKCVNKYMKKHRLISVAGINPDLFECHFSQAKRRGPVPGKPSSSTNVFLVPNESNPATPKSSIRYGQNNDSNKRTKSSDVINQIEKGNRYPEPMISKRTKSSDVINQIGPFRDRIANVDSDSLCIPDIHSFGISVINNKSEEPLIEAKISEYQEDTNTKTIESQPENVCSRYLPSGLLGLPIILIIMVYTNECSALRIYVVLIFMALVLSTEPENASITSIIENEVSPENASITSIIENEVSPENASITSIIENEVSPENASITSIIENEVSPENASITSIIENEVSPENASITSIIENEVSPENASITSVAENEVSPENASITSVAEISQTIELIVLYHKVQEFLYRLVQMFLGGHDDIITYKNCIIEVYDLERLENEVLGRYFSFPHEKKSLTTQFKKRMFDNGFNLEFERGHPRYGKVWTHTYLTAELPSILLLVSSYCWIHVI